MKKSIRTAIVVISEAGLPVAETIRRELGDSVIYIKGEVEGCEPVSSYSGFMKAHFADFKSIVFVGALGICVRSIADCIRNKYADPAVINVDSTGRFVIPVLSGHIGGGNELARIIAGITGGEAVVTTQSDNQDLWALDMLASRYGWKTSATPAEMNRAIFRFVGKQKTALLLECKDKGTDELERTCPAHVDIYYQYEKIPPTGYELLISVGPRERTSTVPVLCFYPQVLHIGAGCRKDCSPAGVGSFVKETLRKNGLSPLAIKSVSTIELKKDEALIAELHKEFAGSELAIYRAEELAGIEVPHPSDKVYEVTGVYGVAESCAIHASEGGRLLIGKQKGVLSEGNHFTFAVALSAANDRNNGHIEIVGAGPGDPELISVRGKKMLEKADLILYAGSLVPCELTQYAKPGATVRSSADMTLEEQFDLMKKFYDQGKFVVRLHTGDPCIYGAIAEQMAFFDQYGMNYHITPGISSFQAAAAALRSQFTIPEKVQSIILTRGEGRTPMPEKEKLHLLARSQSTMCIYLSAAIAEQVQEELLQAYPPETPVAACYKLTWKEEKIYRGQLKDLARIVKENHLTLTTLLVVGNAIDQREGLSRLYSHEFKHLFRP